MIRRYFHVLAPYDAARYVGAYTKRSNLALPFQTTVRNINKVFENVRRRRKQRVEQATCRALAESAGIHIFTSLIVIVVVFINTNTIIVVIVITMTVAVLVGPVYTTTVFPPLNFHTQFTLEMLSFMDRLSAYFSGATLAAKRLPRLPKLFSFYLHNVRAASYRFGQ